MSDRALPPVLVLISDGQPTDDFGKGLDALLTEPWGKKAVRVAIAIGDDADLDVLRRFIAHPEIEPLQANNPEALVRHIRWVSTAVLQAASSPASQMAAAGGSGAGVARSAGTVVAGSNVAVPPAPALAAAAAAATPGSAVDVW
jgi:uncharacterized protein YegL